MRKIIPAVVAGAVALSVAGATFGYAALDKDVQLSVDGSASEFGTMAGTVGQVLRSRGIEVGEHDVVAPALDTTVVDGTRIAVQYGRRLTVTVDGRPQTYWTTATNVDQALAALKLGGGGAQTSISRSAGIGREGLSFSLTTRKTITVDMAGTTRRLATTAPTVGAALAAAKISVDADDRLSTSPRAAVTDGAVLRLTRVDVKTVTTKKKVAYSTTYEETDDLDPGDTKAKTDGRTGVRTTVHSEVRHDGKLESRDLISSKITTAPRTKVVLRGTGVETSESETSDSGDDSSSEERSAGATSGGDKGTAFVTGYTWWDNSPPGSAQISRPVLHERAGGKGTYRDPITVAVGYTSDGPDFAYGTRFYLPDLKKYFIVEDICGACHRARAGTDYTLDIWLDGRDLSSSRATSCTHRVTGKQPVIRKPGSGLPVASGSVC